VAAILLPDNWSRQPSGYPALASNGTIPMPTEVVLPSAGRRGLVGGGAPVVSVTGGTLATEIRGDANGTGLVINATGYRIPIKDEVTSKPAVGLAVFKFSATSASGSISFRGGSSDHVGHTITLDSDYALRSYARFSDFTAAVATLIGSDCRDQLCVVATLSRPETKTVVASLNGGQAITTSLGGSSTADYPRMYVNPSTTGFTGVVYLQAFWYGFNATDQDLVSLSRSPWQIFRKQPRILYFTAPSGGGATIAGDSGTYTLTGSDVSLKAGRKLAADSGSYSLSGTDAAFKRGYALAASSGTYTVSGTAVSLKAGRKLAADSGSYTLTGTDATLTYAPAGSYNLTAESGSYSLTGTAATLRVSRKLSADSGAYSLTGTTATLAKGVRMAAASGSYTLTGSNVSFARTYVLTAESGSYTLTGTSAGLTWSGAPVVEVPTNGGPSIYGKPVFREREFRREYEEQVKRIEDEKRLARILREDEEIICIMALMAA
jgi:hypothetical protein